MKVLLWKLPVRAYFSGSSIQGGLGGAGITIFLDYFGGSSELFSCGLYLGKRIPANSALLQACGFTLLAIFALLFRLSDNPRLYWLVLSLRLGKIIFLLCKLTNSSKKIFQLLRLTIRRGLNLPLWRPTLCAACVGQKIIVMIIIIIPPLGSTRCLGSRTPGMSTRKVSGILGSLRPIPYILTLWISEGWNQA